MKYLIFFLLLISSSVFAQRDSSFFVAGPETATGPSFTWKVPTQVKSVLSISGVADSTITNLRGEITAKQSSLVSGTNIKTINGSSVLGSGDLVVTDATKLAILNNLSDLNNAGTARTNLSLGNVTNESKATMFTNPVFTGTFTAAAGSIANAALANAAVANLSGTNTGDQTTVSGNAGTATALQNIRTIWGQNFNGTANVTGALTLGADGITTTGIIASTGSRVTKLWSTDVESTNMYTVGGTSLSSTFQGLDADLTSWAAVTRASGIDTWVATPSSANLRSALTDENGTGAALYSGNTSAVFNTAVLDGLPTGTGVASAATASTLTARDANANVTANNLLGGYTTTATAALTTTLTVSSTRLQFFTGATTQTLVLPVTSTLTLGHQFFIRNNSSGAVTIQSSGLNTVRVMAANSHAWVTVILTTGTSETSWSNSYVPDVPTTIGITTGTSLAVTGAITSSAGGIGYVTGNGGTVTQATNKATGVTLNKLAGDITLNAASLAAATVVSFTLTNSTIAATDIIHVQHQTTGTFGAYTINGRTAAGSAVISIRNNTAGALAEAIIIKFIVIKSTIN